MGIADFGAGAQDSLERILQRKFLEMVQGQRHEAEMARVAEMTQGNADVQRRFDINRQDDLAANAAAKGERDAAAVAKKAELDAFIQQNPHLAGVVQARGLGLNVKDQHELEAPDVHSVHEADAQTRRVKNIEDEETVRGRVRAKFRAPEKPEKAPGPQLVYGPDGTLRAMQFVNGQYVEVPVPSGMSKAAPKAPPKTPEQIKQEAKARVEGAAEGKAGTGGGGLTGLIRGVFSGGGQKQTKVTVKTPDGQEFSFPNEAAAEAFKVKAGIK
jgi:hypothetical protein